MLKKVGLNDVAANRRRGGEIRVLLGPATVGATSGFMGVVTLQPSEYVSEHYHPYSEEFLYVVKGATVLRVDDQDIELTAGDGLMIPKNSRHRVSNSGTEECLIVFHLGPLAPRPELGHVDTEPLPHISTTSSS